MTALAQLTTLRVGGEPRALVEADDTDAVVRAALEVVEAGDELLVLGGGSNLLVGDDGVDATVLRIRTRGVERLDGNVLRVQAGHDWDELVAASVGFGLAGIEALSGIPGSTGASPVQNIGAYGQELAQTLVAVELLDLVTGERERVDASALELGYRTSVLKQGRPAIVLSVDLALQDAGGASAPVGYSQLAGALGVRVGERAPLAAVRDAVLRLRASKGMVLDPADPDTRSAGSFFTNPVVSGRAARSLPVDAPRYPTVPEVPDAVVPLGEEPAAPAFVGDGEADPPVKLSAAWLIEHAGVARGFALPGSRAAISGKHTLALTNRGGATAAEVLELARYVQTRVRDAFGIVLHPEPVIVGAEL